MRRRDVCKLQPYESAKSERPHARIKAIRSFARREGAGAWRDG